MMATWYRVIDRSMAHIEARDTSASWAIAQRAGLDDADAAVTVRDFSRGDQDTGQLTSLSYTPPAAPNS